MFDRLVTVRTVGGSVVPQTGGGRRAAVTGISKPARNRLLKLLAMVSRTDACAFVTLTTHKNQTNWEESKRDFNRFSTNLRKQFPLVSGVWRFAWQQRGAAHYHLLLWGLPPGDDGTRPSEAALSRIWTKATGEQFDLASLEHAVDSVLVSDFRACGFYLALYQADQPAGDDERASGRTWGTIQAHRLELRAKVVEELTGFQSQYIRRVLRKFRQRWQALRRGKKSRKGMGPLARASGSFSAFLPVESSSRLVAYVVANVDRKHRAIGVEPVA